MVLKVKFVTAKLSEYLPILNFFLLNKKVWGETIYLVYPALKKKLENSKNQKKGIEIFFKKQEDKFDPIIQVVREDFQNSWDKINNEIMIALEEINETKFSEKSN